MKSFPIKLRLSIPLFLSFIFSFTLSLSAQEKIAKTLLLEDLSILKRNLEDLHAGLYAYSSKEQIDQWFQLTKQQLPDSLGKTDFYKMVAPLNGIIKNGHTNVSYPSLDKDMQLFPLQLYIYENSFYIIGSFFKEYEYLIGEEIAEIDGIPIQTIYKTLFKNRRRDGNNKSFAMEDIQAYFGIDHALNYGSKPNYTLTLVNKLNVPPITLKSVSLNENVKKYYNNRVKTKPLSFKVEENIGILTFPTFDTKTLKKAKYKEVLKYAFNEIRKSNIQNLIIDVRNNGGGDPVPTQELLSYLLDKEFVMYKDVYTITNKIKDKKYFKKQGLFWLNAFSWTKVKKIGEGHYRLRNDEGMDLYMPKQNNYKGNLYILANGNSFSATGEFTSFIKNNREVTFIGDEVGGNKVQNTSGVSYTITLPNSKQRVSIPLVLWVMNVDFENDGHGVQPDHWVRNTFKEALDLEDGVMNYTKALIKKSM